EAAAGDPAAFKFPRSLMEAGNLDFSFSGLKTAVLYRAFGQNAKGTTDPPTGKFRADLAASFQQAVVDVLAEKARRALRQTGLTRLAVGGGVAANRALRSALAAMVAELSGELFIPPMDLCTDNAAMAALAVEKWRRGQFAPPDLDAEPNLAFS
ncbi:MAG: tRNA (adenosine(37)-N6)-threonylcarbamoyltransferase complex transferase subunit TsaD, partial [Gemmataceae bacterium]